MDLALTIIFSVVGVLAVIGLIYMASSLMNIVYKPPQIRASIVIRNREDLEKLDVLLCEAENYLCRRHKLGILVLIPYELTFGNSPGPGAEALMRRYNAHWILTTAELETLQ